MTAPDPTITRALCAVARLAYDEVERAGQLTGDTPERVLTALRRWCDSPGDATAEELEAAQDEMQADEQYVDVPLESALALLYDCVDHVALYALSGIRGDSQFAEYAGRACVWAADCLTALGEPRDAAFSRVDAAYDAALQEARARAGRDGP